VGRWREGVRRDEARWTLNCLPSNVRSPTPHPEPCLSDHQHPESGWLVASCVPWRTPVTAGALIHPMSRLVAPSISYRLLATSALISPYTLATDVLPQRSLPMFQYGLHPGPFELYIPVTHTSSQPSTLEHILLLGQST
jgi:hypothetical protein